MPEVFVTRLIPEEGLRLLRERHRVDVFGEDRPITRKELAEGAGQADALLCLLTDGIDAEILDAAPRLKVIANYAVGYDNIDTAEARRRGIVVTNTPGVLTEATADIAFALLIACARRIVESDRWLRRSAFDGWAPMLFRGLDLAGKTVGIVGAGRIGSAMAKRCASGVSMKVLYTDLERNPDVERAFNARFAGSDELLAEADFVSLHAPLTSGTRHLIDESRLSLMKRDAVLVNTARGPLVDERALMAALRERRIFAAGFDVYEFEPEIPEELKLLDNAVILPHIGSASYETRARMSVMAAENILAALDGRAAPNAIP